MKDRSMHYQREAAGNGAHHQRVAPHGSPPGGAGFSRRRSTLRARRSALLKSSRKLFAAAVPFRAAMMHICAAACALPEVLFNSLLKLCTGMLLPCTQ